MSVPSRPLPRLRDPRDTVAWGRQLVEDLQWWFSQTANAINTLTVGAAPSGPAGGDLAGTYPNPSVTNDSHGHTAATVVLNHEDTGNILGGSAGERWHLTYSEYVSLIALIVLPVDYLLIADTADVFLDHGLIVDAVTSTQDWGTL